jgi:hypothetical protein
MAQPSAWATARFTASTTAPPRERAVVVTCG